MNATLRAILAVGVFSSMLPGSGLGEVTLGTQTSEEPVSEVLRLPEALRSSPYGAIVARNAFRLKEPLPAPPPPTNPPPAVEQPKIDVKLAGMAKIKGVRYAYLMVPDTERPGQFQYPTLTDDPEQGRIRHGSGLEVREINLKKQTVRLVNGGIEATINFKDNGVKGAPAPAAAKPGAPGTAPGSNLPKPIVTSASASTTPGANVASPASGEPMVFSRTANRARAAEEAARAGLPPTNPSGIPLSVLSPQPQLGSSDVAVPTRPVRTTGGGGSSVNPATPQVSLEQEYQALLRQRAVADQEGIRLPPIPGMPLPTDPNPH